MSLFFSLPPSGSELAEDGIEIIEGARADSIFLRRRAADLIPNSHDGIALDDMVEHRAVNRHIGTFRAEAETLACVSDIGFLRACLPEAKNDPFGAAAATVIVNAHAHSRFSR